MSIIHYLGDDDGMPIDQHRKHPKQGRRREDAMSPLRQE
jgi:hypothetical protein